jgi:NAD(P)-dependent dehydrogenase (short-subunit alcohol dehydrogenase family)
VQRLGQPEDVAHAAAFFLDERSGFTTGQTVYVCGGMTVGLSAA